MKKRGETRGEKQGNGRKEGGREGRSTHLILLVLSNEILQVGLGLRELQLLHPLAGVPEGEREGGREEGWEGTW